MLTGRQGAGKTTICRILGGPFYREMTGKEVGSRDMKHELRDCWIGEFADLGSLPRAEANQLKEILRIQYQRLLHSEIRTPADKRQAALCLHRDRE